MRRCQNTGIKFSGQIIEMKRACGLPAKYMVMQLGTSEVISVCQKHSYNYIRRDDLFKVEIIT